MSENKQINEKVKENTEIRREELWYDSRDEETKIHAVRWLPRHDKPAAIVQIVHGMTEHILRYDSFARFLAEHDILVVGNDHLGHGMSKRENVPHGYFCKRDPATVVVRDVHRLKKLTQEQHPGVPYVILGHSMGSFILRNYLSRYGTGIDGALILGTGYQSQAAVSMGLLLVRLQTLFLGDQHVARAVDRFTFRNYNKKFKPVRTGAEWLNSSVEETLIYADDPFCGFTFTLNGFQTLFTLVKRACSQEAVRKVPRDLPVMFLAGEDDPVGDFGKSVKASCQSFLKEGMTKVSCKLYKGMRHEILREPKREEVYQDILKFIHGVLEGKKAENCR